MISTGRRVAAGGGVLVAAAGTAGVLAVHLVEPPSAIILFVASAATVLLAMLLPTRMLPALALVVFALLPQRLFPFDALRVVSPAALVMLIWLVRRIVDDGWAALRPLRGVRRTLVIVVGAFLLWCLVSAVFWSPYRGSSAAWILAALLGLGIPLVVRDVRAETAVLRGALPVLGAAIGVYAVVEWFMGDNVVYDFLYRTVGAGDGGVQHWDVYRAEASFGHPLYAAAFLAAALAAAVGDWIQRPGWRRLVLTVPIAGGLAVTVSRGALLSAAIAIAIGLIAAIITARRGERRRRVLIAVALALAGTAIVALPVVRDRLSSVEAASSSAQRDRVAGLVFDAAARFHFLGAGPGTSPRILGNYGTDIIENSYLQLLVSVGIPGLLAFLGVFAVALVAVLRKRELWAACALLAILGSIAFYPAIDSVRPTLVLLGILLMPALAAPASTQTTADGPSERDAFEKVGDREAD